MKVTFILHRANWTGKAATRPDTYRSIGLRFAMKKRNETEAAVRARVNAAQDNDGSAAEKKPIAGCSTQGDPGWLASLRSLARLRSRSGRARLDRGLPGGRVVGAARRSAAPHLTSAAAALVIPLISAPGQEVDLHAEVANLVQVKEIEAQIG